MKLHILSIPSQPIGNNIRVLDSSEPDILCVHQNNDDGTETDWSISRADFLKVAVPKYPESVALPTVSDDWMKKNCQGGHWWLANGTYKGIQEVLLPKEFSISMESGNRETLETSPISEYTQSEIPLTHSAISVCASTHHEFFVAYVDHNKQHVPSSEGHIRVAQQTFLYCHNCGLTRRIRPDDD